MFTDMESEWVKRERAFEAVVRELALLTADSFELTVNKGQLVITAQAGQRPVVVFAYSEVIRESEGPEGLTYALDSGLNCVQDLMLESGFGPEWPIINGRRGRRAEVLVSEESGEPYEAGFTDGGHWVWYVKVTVT